MLFSLAFMGLSSDVTVSNFSSNLLTGAFSLIVTMGGLLASRKLVLEQFGHTWCNRFDKSLVLLLIFCVPLIILDRADVVVDFFKFDPWHTELRVEPH